QRAAMAGLIVSLPPTSIVVNFPPGGRTGITCCSSLSPDRLSIVATIRYTTPGRRNHPSAPEPSSWPNACNISASLSANGGSGGAVDSARPTGGAGAVGAVADGAATGAGGGAGFSRRTNQ